MNQLLVLWKRAVLWRQLLSTALLASLSLIAGYGCGRAIDCSPGQQDGQCGLGTFVGILTGAIAGAVILLAGCSIAIWKLFTRRRLRLRTAQIIPNDHTNHL